MANIEPPNSLDQMPLAIVKNMIALATSGFGVVVALAWNEAIKKTVITYIDPFLGEKSGVASLFIYAVIVTLLAVVVTMQMAHLQRKFEDVEKVVRKKKI